MRATDNKAKSNYKLYYDRRHGSCLLTVRQPVIRTENGNIRRNRKHLRFFKASSEERAFEEQSSLDQEQEQACSFCYLYQSKTLTC